MLFGSEASEQQRLSRGAIVHFFALQGPQSRNNQELLCCCYLALGHFWPLNLLSFERSTTHNFWQILKMRQINPIFMKFFMGLHK